MAVFVGNQNYNNFFLGITPLNSLWQGSDLVWPTVTNTIFIGSGSTQVPNLSALQTKIYGATAIAQSITGSNVSGAVSTFYAVSNSAFTPNISTISSYIDGGYCTELLSGSFGQLNDSPYQPGLTLKEVSFPNVTKIGFRALRSNPNLATASFPRLIEIGANAFDNCFAIVSHSYGGVKSMGALALAQNGGPSSCKYVYLPSLSGSTALGGSTGNDSVFVGYNNNGFISVPVEYNTNNAGNPDGDLAYLFDRGWRCQWLITSNQFTQSLQGSPGIYISASNVVSKSYLDQFLYNSTLYDYSNPDSKTTIVSSSQNYGISPNSLNNTNVPNLEEYIDGGYCRKIDYYGFAGSTVRKISFPNCNILGPNAFRSCNNLVSASFPNANSVGSNCFRSCSNLKYVYLPNLSGSNALGGSPAFDGVFSTVSPSGTITVPSYLSASNAGAPDGDLQYLTGAGGSGRSWTINYI